MERLRTASAAENLGPRPGGSEQRSDVFGIAGEDKIAVLGEEADMSVHHVRPLGRSAERTNISRHERVQGPLVGSLEQSAQASLPRTPSPNLGHSPRRREHRVFSSSGHLDESANGPVAAVECDQCAGVE